MPHQSNYWPYEIDALLAKIPLLQNQVNGVTNLVFVSSTSQMTDTSRAYVNTTNGQWYLYENGGWVAKGQYGGVAVDDTLSTTGAAADAKKTGDELAGRVKKTGDTVTGNLTVVGNIGQTGMLNVTRPQGASLPLIRMNNTDTNRRAEVAMDNDGSLALRNHSLESQWQNYTSLVLNTESGALDNALQVRVRIQGTGGTHTIFGSHNKGMFIDTTLTKAGYAADAKSVGDAIPSVDSTLTVQGAAADAKSVGDAITAARALIPAVDATLTVEGAAADAHVTGTFIGAIRDELAHKIGDSGTQEMEGPLIITGGSDDQYTELARYDDTNQFHILNTGRQGQTASLIIDSNHINGAGPIGLRTQDTAGEEQFYAIFGTHNKHSFIDPQLKYSNWAADAEVTGTRINAVRAAIPAVDTTLTTQGAAADAKATGDAIAALEGRTNYVQKTELKSLVSIGGGIRTNGTINTSESVAAAYSYSDYIPMAKGTAIDYYRVRVTNLCLIAAYDRAKSFDATNSVTATAMVSGTWTMPYDGYVRLCCRNTELSGDASFAATNYTGQKLSDLEMRVDALEESPFTAEWEAYLSNKKSEVRNSLVAIGDSGISFTFVTDCHVPRNNMLTPLILKKFEHACPVDYHINGGDFIDINTDAQSAIDVLWQWKDAMDGITEFSIRGNHDDNNYNGENAANALTAGQFYAIMLRPIEGIVNTGGKTYYVVDNDAQKMRIIMLDSSLADKAVMYAWLKQRLTELDDLWTILVVQHYLWGSTTDVIHANGQATIDAINEVWGDIQADFIGILAGHTHVDYNATEPVNGYHLIARDCNKGSKSDQSLTSLSFDYVTVNKIARTILFKKIGRGNDLSLSY